jgi:integrase
LRTKAGVEQRHRDTDSSPEGVRRRRSTANRVLTILKGALNHAHREGKCASDDAWRTVRAFREADAARLRYLSDAEARRLTNACPADFRALVTGALLSGCRYGELAAMTVDDFNPDAGTLRVRASKSGKPRHVVLRTRICRSARLREARQRAVVPPGGWEALGQIGATAPARRGLCEGEN